MKFQDDVVLTTRPISVDAQNSEGRSLRPQDLGSAADWIQGSFDGASLDGAGASRYAAEEWL